MDLHHTWAEMIYGLITGELAETNNLVTNEFYPDSLCSRLYQEIGEAQARLEQKLGDPADPDITLILENMGRISQYLGVKMFEYGAKEIHTGILPAALTVTYKNNETHL